MKPLKWKYAVFIQSFVIAGVLGGFVINAQAAVPMTNLNLYKGVAKISPEEQKQLQKIPAIQLRQFKEKYGKDWFTVLKKTQFDLTKVPHLPFPLLLPPPKATFANGAPCYYRNWFFNKNVQAYLKNSFNEQIDEYDRYGHYEDFSVSNPGTYSYTGDCDGLTTYAQLTIPNPQHFTQPPIIFNNRPPVVASFKALVNGNPVAGARKNTNVQLVAQASDPDGDPLVFTWGVNAGRLVASNGNRATWRLPNSGGLNFAYVLVNDGKGGYQEASVTVSSDAGTVPAATTVSVVTPADRVPAFDHFLTYFSSDSLENFLGQGADSRMGACRYYVSIGAAGGCGPDGEVIGGTTFSAWKRKWGLNNANAGFKASYANKRDLFLERDMHGIQKPQGTAYYVCNYPFQGDPNFANILNHQKLVACVAMEYSATPGINGGQKFTKFLVFAPSGSLLSSVNLDQRGEKFIPGSCVVCHGANPGYTNNGYTRIDEHGFTSPAFNAQFLPFDLGNLEFPNRTGLRQADQEVALRNLNRLVLTTNPAPTIADVIQGWYPTSTSLFHDNFVPVGWAAHATVYNNVVKHYCRTCHVAMGPDQPNDPLNFRDFSSFNQLNFLLASRVCGIGGVPRNRWAMPNSKQTFNLFWDDPAAVQTLHDHLVSAGEITAAQKCILPQ